jgi:hypothetical protein
MYLFIAFVLVVGGPAFINITSIEPSRAQKRGREVTSDDRDKVEIRKENPPSPRLRRDLPSSSYGMARGQRIKKEEGGNGEPERREKVEGRTITQG